MQESEVAHPERLLTPPERLAALTDGVFAIAITLLALEVSIPLLEEGSRAADLTAALIDQWPSYTAYTVTFFLVGAYWINHHRMFNLVRGVDHRFLLLNILFLMSIAIIPFPNALLAEYLQEPEMRTVVVVVYGASMLALAAMFNAVWLYAGWKGRLTKPHCDLVSIRRVLNSYLMGPAIYGLAIVLGFVVPTVSLVVFVVVPVGYMVEGPVGQIRHEPEAAET